MISNQIDIATRNKTKQNVLDKNRHELLRRENNLHITGWYRDCALAIYISRSGFNNAEIRISLFQNISLEN